MRRPGDLSHNRHGGGTASAPDASPTLPRVGARFIGLLTVASVGLWMSILVPLQVLIAGQVEAVAPQDKEADLAVILTAGAAVGLVVGPVAGLLSDAGRSRFGRRRPWAAIGAVLGAAALTVLSQATTVPTLLIGWVLCQVGLNTVLASLSAVVPDRVPVRQRGLVSAFVGMAQILGTVCGIALVNTVGGDFPRKYAAVSAVLVVTVALFVLAVPEPPAPAHGVPTRPAPGRLLADLWTLPRRHPDFGWAWLTRFLVYLGYAMGTLYLLYYLRDRVRYESLFPGRRAEDGVLVLTSLAAGALLLTIVVGGVVSDRIGRRKVMVAVSTAVIAVGPLLLALSPTWPAAMAAAVAMGAGFGVYLAVDFALLTEVLPSSTDHARDLGIVNIASALPQMIAPVLCGTLVVTAGYPTLFAVAAVSVLLGAVLVYRIRGVR